MQEALLSVYLATQYDDMSMQNDLELCRMPYVGKGFLFEWNLIQTPFWGTMSLAQTKVLAYTNYVNIKTNHRPQARPISTNKIFHSILHQYAKSDFWLSYEIQLKYTYSFSRGDEETRSHDPTSLQLQGMNHCSPHSCLRCP